MRQPFLQRYPELISGLPEDRVLSIVREYTRLVTNRAGPEPTAAGWVAAHSVVALDETNLPLSDRWPWEERVEIDVDGDVLRGDIAVAAALVEAVLATNPTLVMALLERWIDEGRHADDAERDWRLGWERQLEANPAIAWELERSPEALLERAGLSAAAREVYRRALAGESARDIATAAGVARSTVRRWIDEGTLKLQLLRVG